MLYKYQELFMAFLSIMGVFIPTIVAIIIAKTSNPKLSFKPPIDILVGICILLCFVSFLVFLPISFGNVFKNIVNFFCEAFVLFYCASTISLFIIFTFSAKLYNLQFLYAFLAGFVSNFVYTIIWIFFLYPYIQSQGLSYIDIPFHGLISDILNYTKPPLFLAWFSATTSTVVFLPLKDERPLKKIIVINCTVNVLLLATFSFVLPFLLTIK